MPIRMSGLASGLDTEAIVGALMSEQSLKKTKVEREKTKLEWKQTKWAELNTKLLKLYNEHVSKLQLQASYMTKKASVSELAQEMGIPKENVVIMSSGKVLELKEEGARFAGEVQAQGIMVDGLGVGDVGNIVLRDRQHLSENGLLVVVLTLEKGSNQVISGPDIVSRGFVYVREAENLMDECLEIVNIALDRIYDRGVTDWGRIKAEIKDSLNDFLWKKTKRNPMILPIIMEV